MLSIIIIIPLLAIAILCIGFLEVRIPFISVPAGRSHKKLSRHTRKMLHKRIWYNHTHTGFMKLPT
jgi:hypothetical protein